MNVSTTEGGTFGHHRGEVGDDADGGVVHRLGVPGQDDQAGDRGLGGAVLRHAHGARHGEPAGADRDVVLGDRLCQERAGVDADTVASLSADDHRRAFAAALATLAAEFDAYLGRDGADPVGDQVGYRRHAVWLSPEELDAMIEGMRGAIGPHLANGPRHDRARYLVNPVLFPVEAPPAEARTEDGPDAANATHHEG
ncbi:hypothetical protein DFP74_5024 [Nocardiopsis sp. Huas11]|uniref:hypothetical protein n=1 Tax=Nocardiopsis sp. Huas11 TaxID=2183912 RepID=UPI000EB45359|nr:hypothetical protein [Nocardiopsis sp. Huas11]RKS09289.1 hypothetical protein DFP74_5024 [Nocardiopsis sp. Huas11]